MTEIVELSVSDDEFLLGRTLADAPDVRIELERIIPTGEAAVPFLWVRGTDLSAFEQEVVANEAVAALDRLDRLDGWSLYRIEWDDTPHSLLQGIDTTGGAILEARRDDDWTFRLRFPERGSVSRFYDYCREQDVSIRIERSFTLAEKSEVGRQFGLSREQREALLLALRKGYFDTPSQTSLSALAVEFDISEQALSNRIRRGTKTVLGEALLS
ncbi:bacterio-opsin activator [Salinigranum rubrum]|uniref:Bacterio-opsin activator n=1 Tax=Salinigranum rubrum TaxID=755307 RepID=A0A2I8VM59_9EURY|nr:bacterio-opsin activator domain-containing protein [Salinigranum rubrum]AUV83013.1 bacterio-opsin activator [Salinigranum rubrum]